MSEIFLEAANKLARYRPAGEEQLSKNRLKAKAQALPNFFVGAPVTDVRSAHGLTPEIGVEYEDLIGNRWLEVQYSRHR